MRMSSGAEIARCPGFVEVCLVARSVSVDCAVAGGAIAVRVGDVVKTVFDVGAKGLKGNSHKHDRIYILKLETLGEVDEPLLSVLLPIICLLNAAKVRNVFEIC